MTDIISPQTDVQVIDSQIHNFRPLSPDTRRDNIEPVKIVETEEKVYTKNENKLISLENPKKIEKSTIFGASFMITNLCLGTTIFTFAVRTKAFGLVWFLVACILVAAIN